MKTIKRRIKSVSSTMQITKAMELVASSKQRKAKAQAEAARPYFETQYEMLTEIASEDDFSDTIFTKTREIKNRLFIVIAGDRGMAGGYNSNVFKMVAAAHKDDKNEPKIIAIGKKTVDYFEKRGYDVILKYPGFAENLKVGYCSDIANSAVDMFRNGEVDEVKIFYTAFVSSLQQNPSQLKLLPVDEFRKKEDGSIRLTSYDPTPEAVFDRLVPKFLLSIVFCAVRESYACEQSARRIAMESATDNAGQMIESLSLLYNRARQEKITNEINEIVSGANAI
jgi:F-type H+-transporting ATPase subunit gamma